MPCAFSADSVSFQDDVHPILSERCFKCHAGDDRKGGFSMNTRDIFLEGGEFGDAVEIGDSRESLLLELITSTDSDEHMPPKGERLTPEQIDILARWIDAGLDWTLSGTQEEIWQAPLHLPSVKLPRRKGIHKSKKSTDRIIGAYFKKHDLDTPELVDDRQYIRRVYMDLIGLLPTTDAVNAFVVDKNRHKREVLVDVLLSDDRSYAEHWMTFWNDALRNDYKGTGYIDGGRKQITTWLYRALNKNKPYDVFARELIAPRGNAEGFINGIKWRGAETANQQVPLQAARSVSQVFLGINMKCASCHDSFVNQWKLSDAYGLANAFATAPMEIARCDTPTGAMAKTQFLWSELGTIDAEADLETRRKQVADLVTTPENGWFARTIVNRLWKTMMGRGLVEPLDSMDAEPWNAELLDALSTQFVEEGYDLRILLKTIVTSKAYQLKSESSKPNEASYTFTGPLPRRLTVEQLYDAMGCVTNVWQAKAESDPKTEEGSLSEGTVRAWRSIADPMMLALGRPNREQIMLARETDYTRLHAMELTNGKTLATYLTSSATSLLKQGNVSPTTVFEQALGRPPTTREATLLESYGDKLTKTEDVEDILWLLFNHPEFQIVF
ncbi:MAG: PSD1 and planctomycete cytochrome C domain-containing protein [Candidatus Hydrogenedentota bacterium]